VYLTAPLTGCKGRVSKTLGALQLNLAVYQQQLTFAGAFMSMHSSHAQQY
jgi:hypothetical protein